MGLEFYNMELSPTAGATATAGVAATAGPSGGTGTQAIDRAAELLAQVVSSSAPRTFTSLVEATGLAKSTASRLLQALERHRLVQRDRAGAFRPGAVFALYAARNEVGGDFVELTAPALDRLAQATGETVNLAVPRGDVVVQIAQVDSAHLLGMTNWVGVGVPAHCSALGKVFYAYGTLALPTGPLERRTPHTITNRTELQRDLATVARRGYAIAREELEPGLVAIASPLRAHDGVVVAAISVSGPTARISERVAHDVGALLVAETAGLSSVLGRAPIPPHRTVRRPA
jgi:IclR family transcriptional regulator, acetate operon repressor